MRVCKEIDFSDLMRECLSGAIDTLEMIQEHDKEDELMALLEENFFEEVPTLTAINDLLWFDSEWIFETLEIDPDEEEDLDDD